VIATASVPAAYGQVHAAGRRYGLKVILNGKASDRGTPVETRQQFAASRCFPSIRDARLASPSGMCQCRPASAPGPNEEEITLRTRTRIGLMAGSLACATAVLLAGSSPAFAEAPGKVVASQGLLIHDCGGLSCDVVGGLADGTPVTVWCQISSDWVDGNWGWTNIWDRITPYTQDPEYVSDGFVDTGSNGFVTGSCH
jgi:hypothetical protein